MREFVCEILFPRYSADTFLNYVSLSDVLFVINSYTIVKCTRYMYCSPVSTVQLYYLL